MRFKFIAHNIIIMSCELKDYLYMDAKEKA